MPEPSDDPLLHAIEAVSISPAHANARVAQYYAQARRRHPQAAEADLREIAARQIVGHYARLAATSGGVTALAGVLPGIGTAIAMLGGGMADMSVSMKLQVDMTMCLAANFGWNIGDDDARYLTYLIAATGSLEKLGVGVGGTLASRAGVTLLRQYLKGAALAAVKQLFRKLGLGFSRMALEKALPFGIGVAVGASANYVLTQYVGHEAIKWFLIDRDLGNRPAA